jgi:hypothetical protein
MKKMILVIAATCGIILNLNPASAQTVRPENCVFFNAQYDDSGRVVQFICAANTRQAALVPALVAAGDPSRATSARTTEWTASSSAGPAYAAGYGYGSYGFVPPPPYDYRAEAEWRRSLASASAATLFEAAMRGAADAAIRDGQHAQTMAAFAGVEQSVHDVGSRLRMVETRRQETIVPASPQATVLAESPPSSQATTQPQTASLQAVNAAPSPGGTTGERVTLPVAR